MPERVLITAAVLVLGSACVVGSSSPPIAEEVALDEPEHPLIPAEPANRAAGDELDASLSLLGGGTLELSSLRGRPVLLEISASWEPSFAEAHALYVELLDEHPELAVIVVIADPDDGALAGLPAALIPAWDPAGALAAKLSVAILPTMFVIDRAGRIREVVNGWNADVREALRSAVAGVAARVD
jgi:hypothetical protein